MTLVEPASSLTDFALGALALFAAIRFIPRDGTEAHWRWFFTWIGIAGVWGGIHHGFIVSYETAAGVSWSAISLLVAIAISHVLAASIGSVLGKGRGQPLMIIRAVSLAVFFLLVVSGNSTITTLLFTEGLAMAIVVFLWVRAWRTGLPGGGLVLAAIILSMVAAASKASGAHFDLGGWDFDPNSVYHLAQMPGICLLLVAVQRRADAAANQLPWRSEGVAAPA